SNFNSLLKNLVDTPQGDDPSKTGKAATPGIDAPAGAQMTMSEQDALLRQLAGCWNVLAGAKFAEDISVDLHLIIGQDRTVQQATIVDQMRYNADSHYKAAADS